MILPRAPVLRLTYWLWASMPEYSSTIPTMTTPGKVWRRREPYGFPTHDPLTQHYVGMYGDSDTDEVPIYWFHVVLIEGPERPRLTRCDWSNEAHWKKGYI